MVTGARAAGAGYTLVALVVVVAVMNIAVAASLPFWSQIIKRDKEAELIFRGLQYAEAIRVFQLRHNRLPNTLDELIEINPRSIRRLWKDPMTESGEWDLVKGTVNRGGGGPQGRPRDLARGTGPEDELGDEDRRATGRRDVPGPIIGVRSRSNEASIREFMGGTSYNSWLFTIELIPVPQTIPDTLLVPRPTSDWIGKPFRQGFEPEQGGAPGRDLVPRDDDDDE